MTLGLLSIQIRRVRRRGIIRRVGIVIIAHRVIRWWLGAASIEVRSTVVKVRRSGGVGSEVGSVAKGRGHGSASRWIGGVRGTVVVVGRT